MFKPSQVFAMAQTLRTQLADESRHTKAWLQQFRAQYDWTQRGKWPATQTDARQLAKANSGDGSLHRYLPFELSSPTALSQILHDASRVARMQAGVCSVSRSIVPVLQRLDDSFMELRTAQDKDPQLEIPPNTRHVGAAYRAVKLEISSAIEKFGECRDEFLLHLRHDSARNTAKNAMEVLFEQLEIWVTRLEHLASFCAEEEDREYTYVDLHAPADSILLEDVGVRISQWAEADRYLVKFENVGPQRIQLTEALFTMPADPAAATAVLASMAPGKAPPTTPVRGGVNTSASAPKGTCLDSQADTETDLEGASESEFAAAVKRWVDRSKLDRILTPLPVRALNFQRRAMDKDFVMHPSYICFSFARDDLPRIPALPAPSAPTLPALGAAEAGGNEGKGKTAQGDAIDADANTSGQTGGQHQRESSTKKAGDVDDNHSPTSTVWTPVQSQDGASGDGSGSCVGGGSGHGDDEAHPAHAHGRRPRRSSTSANSTTNTNWDADTRSPPSDMSENCSRRGKRKEPPTPHLDKVCPTADAASCSSSSTSLAAAASTVAGSLPVRTRCLMWSTFKIRLLESE